ncbi:MAG TPA: DUF58 domain-containing protein [Gemmataceae bacterium]|jgi:uncharacterized protein (DUF58 family)|nr:DUF58 domain-containing protein [Gemmataceae bacterium]
MLPTRLTVLLFLLSLLFLPGGAFYPPVVWAVLGYDGCLFILLFADALLSRAASSRLRARRERPARLSIGTDNPVVLVLENLTRRAVRVIARDEPPPGFGVEPAVIEASVPPHTSARLSYRLLPTDRGNFTFGNIYLRCRGPLGLAWTDRAVEAGEAVQVYPNLLEVRRYEALVRTTLVRAGGYRSRRLPGAGREFSHFRDYSVDDDYRQVNWKATAHRARPITAVFESEHSQDIIFCLDVGRMMAARVGNLTKLDHAINAVLMLTHVSQTFQDNLGLLIFSHTVHHYLPPAKGRAQYAHFLQALYNVKPELCYVNYREAFQYLIGRHPKRALTMVFTDLLDRVVSSEYQEAARLLRRFHLPLTLAVADVPLQSLAARVPQTQEQLYDILVARDLLQSRAELLQSLERQGVMVLDTVPERLTVDAVNRYLALKTGARI